MDCYVYKKHYCGLENMLCLRKVYMAQQSLPVYTSLQLASYTEVYKDRDLIFSMYTSRSPLVSMYEY